MSCSTSFSIRFSSIGQDVVEVKSVSCCTVLLHLPELLLRLMAHSAWYSMPICFPEVPSC